MSRQMLRLACCWFVVLGIATPGWWMLGSAPRALAQNATGDRSTAPPRPNLLLILADDLGYGDVGFQGAPDLLTPRMDQLAQQGMRFRKMRANATVCSPTRAAILTGKYPDRVGVPGVIRTNPRNSWGFLDPSVTTLADQLGGAGYHTAIVGKWHLGLEEPNLPNQRGFDFFHGFLGDMMDDYYTHQRHGKHYMRRNRQVIYPEGHATDLFTDWAIDYLRQRSQEPTRPFFLYLPYNAPHFPIQPPEDWLEKVQQRAPELSLPRARNVALIEHLDHSIGRVLDALKELSLEDNTVVVLTSDNGGSLPHSQRNLPWRDGKQSHYDGGLRVPFVIRFPGEVPPGSQSEVPGLTFDVAPTFLDLAGVDIPKSMDAISLRPQWKDPTSPVVERELYFVRREGGDRYVGAAYHALIRGRWKLMQNSPSAPWELYDLQADAAEVQEVADRHPGIVSELKKRLSWHIQQGGQVPWQSSHENRRLLEPAGR